MNEFVVFLLFLCSGFFPLLIPLLGALRGAIGGQAGPTRMSPAQQAVHAARERAAARRGEPLPDVVRPDGSSSRAGRLEAPRVVVP